MADTESGDRAALLLISTFFQQQLLMQDQETKSGPEQTCSCFWHSLQEDHCHKIRKKEEYLFFPGTISLFSYDQLIYAPCQEIGGNSAEALFKTKSQTLIYRGSARTSILP